MPDDDDNDDNDDNDVKYPVPELLSFRPRQ